VYAGRHAEFRGYESAPPTSLDRPRDCVEIRQLSHRYHGRTGAWVQALEGIDLRIAAGTFVAILGPSGCGKTTLLRILSGLLEPTLGDVCLAGDVPAAARRRRAIGWLAQEDGLLPWLSVADNVRLPLRLAHAPRSGAELELLRRVGLDGHARQYPHELSGGMRQRVALARALVARPPFLLLDEPFAHLDELTRERLGDVLLELRTESEPESRTPIDTESRTSNKAEWRSAIDPERRTTFESELRTASEAESRTAIDTQWRTTIETARRNATETEWHTATEAEGRSATETGTRTPPTTVLVTHSVAEAVRLADRIVVLSPRPGRVAADVEVELAYPRHEDQPGFGRLVRELKGRLMAPVAPRR
jgi:ABC-type nitrate/sulfonate/bicarbonate transport system ATPase subunit